VNFKILVSMMILSALPSISHKAFQNGRRWNVQPSVRWSNGWDSPRILPWNYLKDLVYYCTYHPIYFGHLLGNGNSIKAPHQTWIERKGHYKTTSSRVGCWFAAFLSALPSISSHQAFQNGRHWNV
jgi:hypothetical protein